MLKSENILKQSIRKCSSRLIIVIFFSFFINILMFVAPLHMLQIYDRVLVSRSEITLIVLTGLAVGLLVVYGLLEGVRTRLMSRIGLEFDDMMSNRLLDMAFDLAVIKPSLSSQQLVRDVDTVREFIGGQAIIALCDAPWVPIFIAACFILHPLLGFVSLAGALIVFLLAASNELLTRKTISEANRLWIKTAHESMVSLRNSEIVRALGMVPGLKSSWARQRDTALAYQLKANDRGGAILAASRFVRMALQVIILATGGYLAIQDQITPGMMIAASIIMGRALAPVEMATSQWRNFIGVRDAFRRINEMIDDFPDRPEAMELPPPRGLISLQGVFINAPEQIASNLILSNISMEFHPKTITGIIGPSGCGKSSLVRALVGVWPAFRGVVRYDGANIQNWQPEKLGRHLGYMPQDVELFDGSVAENISRFQGVNSEEVIAAAKKAGVHELILQLPNGYDTNIGAGGQALSGGQRQRIALARALYLDPKIIVLDEPNSNLDRAGETALTKAITQAKERGATIIVVSHRPSLLSSMDRVAVLNKGALVKIGPRDQILSDLGASNISSLTAQSTKNN